MNGNKLSSVIAGVIVGFLLGTTFYIISAKCLIVGPLPNSGELFISSELQAEILKLSARYGGFAGAIVGLLGGLSIPLSLPRGHMSKSISCMSFFVCTIMAFIQHGHFLAQMTAGRIVITFLWVLGGLIMAIPFGQVVSFIEGIRE